MSGLAAFFLGVASTLAVEILLIGAVLILWVRKYAPMDDWKD